MIKLKSILNEGAKENAALDYLSNLIKVGPFRNRVFLAGGAVRDMEIGKDPKDLDVVVKGDINSGIEFSEWATRHMNNYKKGSNPVVFPAYGTAKFTLNGIIHNGIDLSDVDIEAVATRKEEYTAGSRKPKVSDGDLEDDVKRRDLTVNSLLQDLTTGEVLDLTGMGKADIKRGIVRTPLNPNIIFSEDPLRMLRAVRFAFKYSWDLPMFMIRSMKKNSSKLKTISNERIRDELDKILVTGSPDRAMKLLRITNLLNYIIPEFKAAYKMTQNVHHSKDVFGHTLDVLKKTEPVLIRRLMALFHDIGKTVTRSVTPSGVHFYGHEHEGAKMVVDVMRRLKYPNEIIDAVQSGVTNHMKLKHGGDSGVKISDKSLRKFKMQIGDNLDNILDVIHADNIAHSEASNMPNQIANVKKRLDTLVIPSSNKPVLPINGADLKELGIKPGPIFSELLGIVTDEWFNNPNMTKEEAIELVKRNIN